MCQSFLYDEHQIFTAIFIADSVAYNFLVYVKIQTLPDNKLVGTDTSLTAQRRFSWRCSSTRSLDLLE